VLGALTVTVETDEVAAVVNGRSEQIVASKSKGGSSVTFLALVETFSFFLSVLSDFFASFVSLSCVANQRAAEVGQ